MKKKYNGILAIAVSLAALSAVGGYWQSGVWKSSEGSGIEARPPVVPIKVPSESQVGQMNKLYGKLPQLSSPHARAVAGNHLTLFGHRVDGADTEASDGEAEEASQAQLSLIVMAGSQRYCILDGHFLFEGEILEEGLQVLKIENHRVLVSQNQTEQWIYLEEGQEMSAAADHEVKSGSGKGQI